MIGLSLIFSISSLRLSFSTGTGWIEAAYTSGYFSGDGSLVGLGLGLGLPLPFLPLRRLAVYFLGLLGLLASFLENFDFVVSSITGGGVSSFGSSFTSSFGGGVAGSFGFSSFLVGDSASDSYAFLVGDGDGDSFSVSSSIDFSSSLSL